MAGDGLYQSLQIVYPNTLTFKGYKGPQKDEIGKYLASYINDSYGYIYFEMICDPTLSLNEELVNKVATLSGTYSSYLSQKAEMKSEGTYLNKVARSSSSLYGQSSVRENVQFASLHPTYQGEWWSYPANPNLISINDKTNIDKSGTSTPIPVNTGDDVVIRCTQVQELHGNLADAPYPKIYIIIFSFLMTWK